MATKDLSRLKAWLETSGIQRTNNPLHQVINALINRIDEIGGLSNLVNTTGSGIENLVGANQMVMFGGRDIEVHHIITDGGNNAKLHQSNLFTVINPLITPAESWIGPSSTSGIYFKSSNVGVGTITPNSLYGTAFGMKLGITGPVSISAGAPFLIFDETDQAADSRLMDIVLDAGIMSIRKFNDNGSSTVNIFSIVRSSGNVGIGTTTPTNTTLQLEDTKTFGWSDIVLSRSAANRMRLATGDVFNLQPTAFASLPAGSEGDIACVTDSNTATWGATIAGGGANNVAAFHNGTNWTVMAV